MNFYEDCMKLVYCKYEDTENTVKELTEKYNVSKETVYYRIRTYFGDKLKNLRFKFFEPDRNTFIKHVLLSENKDDLRRKYYSYMPESQWNGIYDRVLGVSTYQKSKLVATKEMSIKKYNPSSKDNLAMISAIRLGDGSYDKDRHAIRIEHCEKQKDWLEKKVELILKSFPYLSSKIVQTNRQTYRWYSKKIISKKYVDLCEKPKIDIIQYLNPFGFWILFLDDGSLTRSSLDFAVENKEIAIKLIEKLREFGFEFKSYTDNSICLKKQVDIQRFLNEMILPFESITPECMKYKIIYKI